MRTLGLRGPQDQREEPGLVFGLDWLCSCPSAITAILVRGPPPLYSYPATAAPAVWSREPQAFSSPPACSRERGGTAFQPLPQQLGRAHSPPALAATVTLPLPPINANPPPPRHDFFMEQGFFNVLFFFMDSPISSLQLFQKAGQGYQVRGLKDVG